MNEWMNGDDAYIVVDWLARNNTTLQYSSLFARWIK
jgi:hypothetical protein